MTIKILQSCGEYLKGAVVEVSDDRATRLIRTGYAEPERVKKPRKRHDANL